MQAYKQPSKLPHRFTEASFRRYEPIIATAMWGAPTTLVLDPLPGLSLETTTCRLRDAMRSLWYNKWPTNVDMQAFAQWYPSAQVRQISNSIHVTFTHVVAPPHAVTELVVNHPAIDDCVALATLCAHGHLHEVRLRAVDVDVLPHIENLPTMLDVSIRKDGDDIIIV